MSQPTKDPNLGLGKSDHSSGDNVTRSVQQNMMDMETNPERDESEEVDETTKERKKRIKSDTDWAGAQHERPFSSRASAGEPKPSSQGVVEHSKQQTQSMQPDRMGRTAADPVPGTPQTVVGISDESERQMGHTAGNVNPLTESVKGRSVSISVCSSSPESSVRGLLDLFDFWKREAHGKIAQVKFIPLPYNDIDQYKFKENDPVDVMILCHSIFNRRFAITDVADALYDKYLSYCSTVIGSGKMAVIVYDFSTIDDAAYSSRQVAFKNLQPKTFNTTSLAITCGNLSQKEPEIRLGDMALLRSFIRDAAQYSGEMRLEPGVRSTFDRVTSCFTREKQHATTMTCGTVTRSMTVGVCACADVTSVQAYMTVMDNLKKCYPEIIGVIQFQRLPYDIDSFKFPSGTPFDVLLLCHSIHDRQLDIYDKFLRYCGGLYGKGQLALIIYGVDFKDITELDVKFNSFQAAHPLTFELVSELIICGRLDEGFIMKAEDTERLMTFFEKVRYGQPVMTREPAPKSMEKGVPGSKVVSSQPLDNVPQPPKPASASPSTLSGSGTTGHSAAVRYAPHPSQTIPEYSTDNKQPVILPMAASRNSPQYARPPCQSTFPPNRRVSVSLCTSAPSTVTALESALENLRRKSPQLVSDVRVRRLPYNDLDTFRFLASEPVDVMVLCHSTNNRGFAITNVTNALYEKYLTYCNKIIGRDKLAVIVHDSNISSESRTSRMETFKKRQPLTFHLVDTVIITGSLDREQSVEKEDLETLVKFLRKASLHQPQNHPEGRLDSMKSWYQRQKISFF
ncbi:uncharacterized protein [Diadema antillarum]|uniref:uncharacterized protein n=1 Tax=Diadema antillarum TaxID=105358 RepID=UPI003A86AE90